MKINNLHERVHLNERLDCYLFLQLWLRGLEIFQSCMKMINYNYQNFIQCETMYKKKYFVIYVMKYHIGILLYFFNKMNGLKIQVLVVMIVLVLDKISATELKDPCTDSTCHQEIENCSHHAACISTLNICRLKCPQPYDYACLKSCDASFNSQYKALISCTQKNGCSVGSLKHGVLLFNQLKT